MLNSVVFMHVLGVGKVALKYSGVNCTFLEGN
jgi:hypothetical protein